MGLDIVLLGTFDVSETELANWLANISLARLSVKREERSAHNLHSWCGQESSPIHTYLHRLLLPT